MLTTLDDETDMAELEKSVRSIEQEGLVWGGGKLVAIGYGIKKLQINLVIEDDKVGLDDLQEKIAEFEDYVQSTDVVSRLALPCFEIAMMLTRLSGCHAKVVNCLPGSRHVPQYDVDVIDHECSDCRDVTYVSRNAVEIICVFVTVTFVILFVLDCGASIT